MACATSGCTLPKRLLFLGFSPPFSPLFSPASSDCPGASKLVSCACGQRGVRERRGTGTGRGGRPCPISAAARPPPHQDVALAKAAVLRHDRRQRALAFATLAPDHPLALFGLVDKLAIRLAHMGTIVSREGDYAHGARDESSVSKHGERSLPGRTLGT